MDNACSLPRSNSPDPRNKPPLVTNRAKSGTRRTTIFGASAINIANAWDHLWRLVSGTSTTPGDAERGIARRNRPSLGSSTGMDPQPLEPSIFRANVRQMPDSQCMPECIRMIVIHNEHSKSWFFP